MDLPIELYSAAQIRELEEVIFRQTRETPESLMAAAGEAAFEAMLEHFPDTQTVAVICGKGNNGGDGCVLARLAHNEDLDVTIYTVGETQSLAEPANAALLACRKAGVPVQQFHDEVDLDVDLIVDAICGIGLKGEVYGEVAAAIDAINRSSTEVFAIDVPSGINSDTGHVMGDAVAASVTITFLGLKQGLFTADATEYVGELLIDLLGIDEDIYADIPITAYRIDFQDCLTLLPERARDAHKGDFGHVLIIAGDQGMPGAAILAGRAALRCGAGLVTIVTRTEHAATVVGAQPELMCIGASDNTDISHFIQQADVVVIGPGIRQSPWAKALWKQAKTCTVPMVIDAGALHLLAADPTRRDDWILTPHPGEAAVLLNCSVEDIQADRFAATTALQEQYGGVFVLKGAGTIVQAEGAIPEICHEGNPGMATPGTGDVLAGVIAALTGQGFDLVDAARAGVSFHARAGDVAAIYGERGLLASDLVAQLRSIINTDTTITEHDADSMLQQLI